jgi:tripeptidyl-peptidase-1
MGPETGDAEIACQSDLGGVITSGGGFSTYNPTPSWQKAAVKSYFQNLLSFIYPTDGYNPKGRGYPDVSLIGVWYEVFIQGELTPIFGTSASAPVFAAFISLANAARARVTTRARWASLTL